MLGKYPHALLFPVSECRISAAFCLYLKFKAPPRGWFIRWKRRIMNPKKYIKQNFVLEIKKKKIIFLKAKKSCSWALLVF